MAIELVGTLAVSREDRHAGARRDAQLRAGDLEGLAEVGLGVLLDRTRQRPFCAHIRYDNGEVVGVDARIPVAVGRLRYQAVRQLFEQLVTARIAQGFVDGLEAVQIQRQHSELALLAPGRIHVLGQSFHEQAAIGQASQRVVEGEITQFLRLADVIQGEGEIVDHLAEQALLIGIEEASIVYMQHQHADDLFLDDHG